MIAATSHSTGLPVPPAAEHSSPAPAAAADPSVSSSTAAESDGSVDSSLVNSVLNAPLYGSRAAQHDIHAYLHNKRIKIRHQYQHDALTSSTFNSPLSSHPTSSTAPPPAAAPASLFAACIFWLNGLTAPPAGQLLPLIYRYGGRVENKLVPVVTHCVSENLPSTKVRDWKDKSRHKRWWLVGGWVMECIRRGRLVAEWDWLVPELRDDGLRTVRGMLERTAQGEARGKQTAAMVVDDGEALTAQQSSTTATEEESGTNSSASPVEQATAGVQPANPPVSPQAVTSSAPASPIAPSTKTYAVTHSAPSVPPALPDSSTSVGQPQDTSPHASPSLDLFPHLNRMHPASFAVPPFIPVLSQPLSFRSISTSSASHAVPPPPPPPDYQSLLLPARPYDSSQQKSRAVSRVMTNTAITAQPLAPRTVIAATDATSASVVPPATRPYLPRAVVQPAAVAQLVQQTQVVNSRATPPVTHSLVPSPPAASHSIVPAPQTAAPTPASSSATSPHTGHSGSHVAFSSVSLLHSPSVPTSSTSTAVVADEASAASPSITMSTNAPSISFPSTSSSPPSSSSVLLPSSMGPTAHQGGPAPRLAGRSTLNDPHFVQTFFAASRLHFIGSWKRLFQALIPALLAIPPRFTASAYPAPSAHRGYILHCDLDCFFASVAARDHPELKDKPVAVCHATAADPSLSANSISSTSSISSCNYVARGFGLHAEMSIGRARRLCPELVLVPYEFEKYAAASEDIYRIFFGVTHRVQAVSLDECYMELPASMKRKEVEDVARDVRRRVETTTGVQLSIGISHSLLLARLATKAAKPNNLSYLTDDPAVLMPYMANLPASDVPGIGYVNSRRLEEDMKVSTTAQLQQLSRDKLQQMFGKKQGITIYEACRGIDHRPLVPVRAGEDKSAAMQRSIAVNINYGIRFERDDQVLLFLHDLSDELLSRLLFTPLCSQLLSMKLMVRHPNAPIEPPHKFLGHGVCDTRSKSRAIDGRPLGEAVVERGGEEERRERDRLRPLVLELWQRLKEEWKFVVPDLRGIGLQLTKMKRRDGRAYKLEAFKAYGFTPMPSPAKGDGIEDSTRPADAGLLADAEEDDEEWKEDGMEVDEDDWSYEPQPTGDASDPSKVDSTFKPIAETVTSPAPAIPTSTTVESVPSAVASSSESTTPPSTLESFLRSALTMSVSPTMPQSSASTASPTVALPLDQLLRLLASVSQQSGLSSLSLSETLATLAGNATALFAPSNQVPFSPLTSAALSPATTLASGSTVSRPSSSPQAAPAAVSSSSASPPTSIPALHASAVRPVATSPARPLTISEVVAEVDAAKERAYITALPAFSSLDRAVIAALPFELRQELANAYKKKRAMEKEEEDKADAQKGKTVAATCKALPSTAAAVHGLSSSSPASFSSAAALVDLPRFSQVDPSVLADLPPSIRAELELEYKRRGASITAQQRSPPAHTRNAKGKKAKGKQADKGRQSNKSIAAVAPSAVARPINGVSIVDHFTAAEHEKRQQQRSRLERDLLAAPLDSEVMIVDWPRDGTRRGSRRQLDMEAAEQQRQDTAMEKKYDNNEEDDDMKSRTRRLREEKEQEQRRRAERQQGSDGGRLLTSREQRIPATSSNGLRVPAFVVVDPSLLPRPPPPSSSASFRHGAPLSPPISSLVFDGADFASNLRSLSSRFVPLSVLQPHLSIWLRTLRTRHPHSHPAVECGCSEAVIGCFCRHCPRWQALLAFLSAQARLRNAELVAAAIAALRAASRAGRPSHGGSKEGGHMAAPCEETAKDGSSKCVCFVCSVGVLVCELQKVVESCYAGVLKCS